MTHNQQLTTNNKISKPLASVVSSKLSVVSYRDGQSLIELLIGLSVGAIFIGGAVLAISFALTAKNINKKSFSGSALAQETLSKVKLVGDAKWIDIYNLNKGTDSSYYIVSSGTMLSVAIGSASTTVDGINYTLLFNIEDVYRNSLGNIVDSGGTLDSSTIKINSYARWLAGATSTQIQLVDYLIRSRNAVFEDANWFGGSSPDQVLTEPTGVYSGGSNVYVTTSGSIKVQGY